MFYNLQNENNPAHFAGLTLGLEQDKAIHMMACLPDMAVLYNSITDDQESDEDSSAARF